MKNSDVVEQLSKNSEYLRTKLRENGFNILNSTTAAIPVIIGDELKVTQISKDLFEKGIFISCIIPPAVPAKTCRLRINVMATHTIEDMDYLVEVLNELVVKYSF